MSDVHPLRVFCLAGPTGCGKTAAALELARELGAEVINADSRQVYADFPCITAQPTEQERAVCPHHLYGFLSCREKISAGRWLEKALQQAKEVTARGLLPLFVGGTGLYFQALLRGIAEIPPIDPAISFRLNQRLQEEGSLALHEELMQRDPEYAVRIHPNDRQRIVRALEVTEGTGKIFSWWHTHAMPVPPCTGVFAFFNPQLNEITPRLAARIDMMIASGALEEAEQARKLCDDPEAPGWSGIGCAELLAYLQGRLGWEECKELWLKNTRAYAKRQLTWFRARPQAVPVAPADTAQLLALARQSLS